MKFFKYSRFHKIQANEFFRIPAKVVWVEHIVLEWKSMTYVLKQGRRIDLGDVFYLLFFPLRMLLILLLGHWCHKRAARHFFETYGDRDDLHLRHKTFYTLDWKKYLSAKPVAWEQY